MAGGSAGRHRVERTKRVAFEGREGRTGHGGVTGRGREGRMKGPTGRDSGRGLVSQSSPSLTPEPPLTGS